MSTLTSLLILDAVLGSAMLTYISIQWKTFKKSISENGWSLKKCTPFTPWYCYLFYYIPVIGIIWYLTVGEMIYTLARERHIDGQAISIELGPIRIYYTE